MDTAITADERLMSEELRFMYDQLRREILNNSTVSMQMLAGLLAVAGILTGFALDPKITNVGIKVVLLFFVWLIARLGMSFAQDRARSTGSIAAYLRLHVETRISTLSWETHLFALREDRKRRFDSWSQIQLVPYNIVSVVAYLIAVVLLLDWFESLAWNLVIVLPIGATLAVCLVVTIMWIWETANWTRKAEHDIKTDFDLKWKTELARPPLESGPTTNLAE